MRGRALPGLAHRGHRNRRSPARNRDAEGVEILCRELALRRVAGQRHADLGAVVTGRDVDLAVDLPYPLLDRLERAAAALGLGVVGDRRDERAVVSARERDGDPRRRPAADRLVEQLADDRVERDLRRLAELAGAVELEVDAERVRAADLVRERAQRGREALVPEHDRLEREREVAQLAARLAVAL